MAQIRRREFIAALGGAAAWPLTARAQQAMPVIGLIGAGSPKGNATWTAAARQGLTEVGYVEGHNVAIEYRWAEERYDRLSSMAIDLVERHPSLIFADGLPAALAAKAATKTIPVVFVSGLDPVRIGLVDSLNRPGGNLTGVTLFTSTIISKRLQLLRELAPDATVLAFLVNPNNPRAESDTKDMLAGAATLSQQFIVLKVGNDDDFETAFATAAQSRVGALIVGNDPFFNSRAEKLAALASRHALPTMYGLREYALAGGLMSYGTKLTESYRQAGIYAGRILKGEKPADLPVIQPSKFELVINLNTAKTLGITVPFTLQVIADELIE